MRIIRLLPCSSAARSTGNPIRAGKTIMSMSRIACKTVRLLAPLLVSLVIASCGGGGGGVVAAVPTAKTWTILVYMDGDNNLSGSALANFAQMQAATGSTNVTVVVQLATLGAATKRWQIKNGQTTPLADLGEVNMARECGAEGARAAAARGVN